MTDDPHPPLADHGAIEALLTFHWEAGVDIALDDAPHDRFAECAADMAARLEAGHRTAPEPAAEGQRRAPVPREAAGAGQAAPNRAMAASADETALLAREAARRASTLDELRAALEAFEGCALKLTAKNLCFADGNPQARLMLVGEAPGGEEDRAGLPFVGRSGKLLDRMLAAIGLDRSAVYIANIVPWRPPGNRTPTPQESAACRPFIERQIALCNPDILVCLGGPSTQALLGARDGILKTRGRWFDYDTGERVIPALATLHPAYLLREPLQKRHAWRDFKALKKALDDTEAAVTPAG